MPETGNRDVLVADCRRAALPTHKKLNMIMHLEDNVNGDKDILFIGMNWGPNKTPFCLTG